VLVLHVYVNWWERCIYLLSHQQFSFQVKKLFSFKIWQILCIFFPNKAVEQFPLELIYFIFFKKVKNSPQKKKQKNKKKSKRKH